MTYKLRTSLIIILLIVMSVVVYLVQFWIYRRPEDMGFYFLEDLAFVPISVLLVTLGLNTVLNRRDRQAMLEKVSIVVNEFYAEAGTDLIIGLRDYMVNLDELSGNLQMKSSWKDSDFFKARTFVSEHPIVIDISRKNILELRGLFESKKDQILRLFENANLMEHDAFTDMLWALYHVYDELRSRDSLDQLPDADCNHLNLDIQRAARLLLLEWLDSMRALRVRYPYLYSLAVRKCPFGECKVVIDS